MQIERMWEFLRRLTPPTQNSLLTELERLELCGIEMPGSVDIRARLRAELHKDGSAQGSASPFRFFFAPLEPFLIDGDPELGNDGRIARGSLAPIWEWIGRDMLPIMARDYNEKMKSLIASDKPKDAMLAAQTFQTKVAKALEGLMKSPDGGDRTRIQLAAYTASRSAYGDLTRMMDMLRARDTLATFNKALPDNISKFDDVQVDKVAALLDALRKTDPKAPPFALALVALHLRTPWQLIFLATRASASKSAADVAATPYAVAVSMVLDQLDDKVRALRIALKKNRVVVARDILVDIYDTEYALQIRIRELDESEWGNRLRHVMDTIAALVDAEVSRFPSDVGHVLKSSSLRRHHSFAGRLSHLAFKARDAIDDGAAACKKLIGQA